MRPLLLASLCLTATLSGETKDRLTLSGGDTFVGKVLALEDGLIEFQSPHGTAPLRILNKSLTQLSFAEETKTTQSENPLPKNSQEILLKNGDRFPGELIALTDEQATFQTWFTGSLEIPRNEIESLSFGVTPQREVYRGPNEIGEWDLRNDRNWSVKDDQLVASTKSVIGKEIDLPKDFIFRSKVSWESNPNARIHLCAKKTSLDDETPGDSYLISLNSSGIKVQRAILNEDDDEKVIYKQLIATTVNLRARDSKTVEIALHVDRSTQMIYLYADQNKVGQGLDPSSPPTGSAMIFESMNHGSSDLMISEIAIDEWDAKTKMVRRDPKAEEEVDTLSVDDGDSFSGSILSYRHDEPEQGFSIKTPLSSDAIQIPLQHCAIMYFASGKETPDSQGRYQINLRVGGQLTVSDIKLGANSLIATHPWLGRLEIDRRVMQSITKGK